MKYKKPMHLASAFLLILENTEVYDQGGENDGNHRKQLDQNVDCRAGSVFERIADSVANDCSFVLIGTFSAVLAAFEDRVGEIVKGAYDELIEQIMQKPITEMKELYNTREIEK